MYGIHTHDSNNEHVSSLHEVKNTHSNLHDQGFNIMRWSYMPNLPTASFYQLLTGSVGDSI